MEYYQKGLYQISQVMAVTLSGMLLKMSAPLLMKAKLSQIINSANSLRENPAYIVYQHARASLFQGIFTAQLYHLILAFKKQNTLRPSRGQYLSLI